MLHPYGVVRDVERLTARVFDSAGCGSRARLDAYRDGDTFHIDIDLPGVDPAGIDVTVDRKVLTVRAARRPAEREGLHLAGEGQSGTCTRQLFLSDTLDTDRLEMRYDNDVLTLRIPVVERAGSRGVEAVSGERQLTPAA
jgi:HSP20 family protein